MNRPLPGTFSVLAILAACTALLARGQDPAGKLPDVHAMAAARTDVWGEAAMRQPGGPGYEFFRDLLPPLRYVNTAFRHYPIVLSAPQHPLKSRWVSNGSAINARANKKPMWRDVGFPVRFEVGDPGEPFGGRREGISGPCYAEGFLPVVQITYDCQGTTYDQEVFAPVRSPWSSEGAVLVQLQAARAGGTVAAILPEMDGAAERLEVRDGTLCNLLGQPLVAFSRNWRWNGPARALQARLAPQEAAYLAVLRRPGQGPIPHVTAEVYETERTACIEAWTRILDRGIQLQVPEAVVQDAWRSLVVGNYLIAVGRRMNYSAGNAYDHLYEAECGDAVRSLLLFGQTADARQMVEPLLDFQRQATRFHVAGHKLQLLTHYYWVTRDASHLRARKKTWRQVSDFVLASRQPANGLLPPDNYAGDISMQVYSLNSNANCWRGLRDLAAVLEDLGEPDQARRLAREAADYRQAILKAVAASERRDVRPPFIPNALFGVEPPHDPLTATRLGSYYDLMAPYIIGSGVFPHRSERETWLIEYLQQHGGVAMGMIRSMPHQGEFNQQPGVNVLYGLRYMLALLRRDDRERALAGFYGHLAQGMTRDTYIGGEGSRFLHGDAYGRSMYLPPNSASNAMFLLTLRYLLIQDWDLDDDGAPETLRLLYGIPARWLTADGLRIERAPSAFGEVSAQASLRADRREVHVACTLPPRPPRRILLRIPAPAGFRIARAQVEGGGPLTFQPDGGVDLSGRTGRVTVRFQLEPEGS